MTNLPTVLWIYLQVFFVLLITLAFDVKAQSMSEHERLIKQGLDRIEHLNAPLRERADVRLNRPDAMMTDFSLLDEAEQCFDITVINILNSHKLPPELTQQATASFVNRCLGLEHINALIGVISNLYLEKGFITSRAYIAPQDLSDGLLEIVVVEGVIEGLSSLDGTISERQLRWAFPVKPGDVLNIRALEQGIENLNGIAQNDASIELAPGAEQGGTSLEVANQTARRWRGSLGVNNSGVPSTGEYQLDGNLVFDNLFGVNDSAFVSASTNIGGHELPHAESRSYAASWSVPMGYWWLSLNNSYFGYEQVVIGNMIEFEISGASLNSDIQVGRNLYRSQTDKLDVALAFSRKDSKNYIEDVFLETSSRTLYEWSLSTEYRRFLPQGTLNINAHIYRSVPWFGATQQVVVAEYDFQFTKYQLNLTYNTQFHVADQPVIYSMMADFLYSPKVIVASEGLTVGGRYSVRGLSQGSLFGYRGGYIRNDFTVPRAVAWSWVDQVNYYVGVDVGMSNLPEHPDKNSDWVAGAIGGAQFFKRNFSANISYARALRVPAFLQQKQQEIDFSIRYSF